MKNFRCLIILNHDAKKKCINEKVWDFFGEAIFRNTVFENHWKKSHFSKLRAKRVQLQNSIKKRSWLMRLFLIVFMQCDVYIDILFLGRAWPVPLWELMVPTTSCFFPEVQYPEAFRNSSLQDNVFSPLLHLHCIWHSPYKSAHLSAPELNRLWMQVVIYNTMNIFRFFSRYHY